MDRLAPTRRPPGPHQGTQSWRSLLFLHWEIDPAALRPHVPLALDVDTYDDRAYVGLVAFTMRDVRPTRLLPALPGVRHFHELNLRTYVHARGDNPGVWFFSLDAANSAAVLAARVGWHLPYFRAEMSLEPAVALGAPEDGARLAGGEVRYASERRWPQPTPATFRARYTIGEPIGTAEPGTLLHFLAERYYLYARKKDGRLVRGQVHHPPYPLQQASVSDLEETITRAATLTPNPGPPHVLWSPGVDVDLYPLQELP